MTGNPFPRNPWGMIRIEEAQNVYRAAQGAGLGSKTHRAALKALESWREAPLTTMFESEEEAFDKVVERLEEEDKRARDLELGYYDPDPLKLDGKTPQEKLRIIAAANPHWGRPKPT